MSKINKKNALISVYNKKNLLNFSKKIHDLGFNIFSSGGTYKILKENKLKCNEISDITKFPEILNGRVKTLHPAIHAGILADVTNDEHKDTLIKFGFNSFDLVVVNLYPFIDKLKENLSENELIEFIDVGGPSMIRGAAKNFKNVLIVIDIDDYDSVIDYLKNDVFDINFHKKLASKAFKIISEYDYHVFNFLNNDNNQNEKINFSFSKKMDLRYGENPHQKASFYINNIENGFWKNYKQLNGKELSFNNIRDSDIAWKIASDFEKIFCVGIKHSIPCGAAIGNTVKEAFIKTINCDNQSIFGGIVAFNSEVDIETAIEINKLFLEVIIAPSYSVDAIKELKMKKNLRVLSFSTSFIEKKEYFQIDGGLLIQDKDLSLFDDLKCVTDIKMDDSIIPEVIFAYKLVKHVKSNAIVCSKDFVATGIGGGMVNRFWAAKHAVTRAKEFNVLASDGFFPFDDIIKFVLDYKLKVIVQPGGSIRDNDSIDLCNKNGICMVFTNERHFKH